MAEPTYAELVGENARLVRENAELRRRCEQYERRISELEDQIRKLTQLLDESTRAAKRQAAPFSKGQPSNPKKPGRKPGEEYGHPSRRLPPPPDQIDETYEALLPEVCPDCGGPVKLSRIADEYPTEFPRRPTNRKVWGVNRTWAQAQSILMSVPQTCRQQRRDGLKFISQTLCGRRTRLALLPAGP